MSAALPLTKTFTYADGGYTTAPYPHVSRLSSYTIALDTLDQFAHALRTHAETAHCLFNAHLQRPPQRRPQRQLQPGPVGPPPHQLDRHHNQHRRRHR